MTVSSSLIHLHFLIYIIIPKIQEMESSRMYFRILRTDYGFRHRFISNPSKIRIEEKLMVAGYVYILINKSLDGLAQ